MSFEQIESGRENASWEILKKFGATIGRCEKNVAERLKDPQMMKLTAARMSLEHAVIATARERSVPTQLVADALGGATVAQQAMMIKEGHAALARTYNVEPAVLVSAFAGKIVEMEMPKGLGSTPDLDKMIDSARNLVTGIVKDEYTDRGTFTTGGNRDGFVALKSEAVTAPHKAQLATRLAFMESAIDASVERGAISATNAAFLKERIEAQVFQPRPPESMNFSAKFKEYFEARGKEMRVEVMKEVRGVTQSRTVQEIAQKLVAVMPKQEPKQAPLPTRSIKDLER